MSGAADLLSVASLKTNDLHGPLAMSAADAAADVYQFVYTSDAHYGVTRTFRGQQASPSQTVNEAMLEEMKVLPERRIA